MQFGAITSLPWGYVKLYIYANKPGTIEDLKVNIQCNIVEIQSDLMQRVFENWTSKLCHLCASQGCHMAEIMFKC